MVSQLALVRSVPKLSVYLTATLPLNMRDELCQQHYLSQVVEVRASTRRSNIAYKVH